MIDLLKPATVPIEPACETLISRGRAIREGVQMFAASDWLQAAVSWAALGSSVVAIVGLIVYRRQLGQTERTLLGATSQFCYGAMTQLLQLLIDKPHLRPYLYDGKMLPAEDEADLRQQVLAIGAHYADFFDTVLHQDSLGNVPVQEYIHVWKGFIREMLRDSSVIRNYVLEHSEWYSPELRQIAAESARTTT